MNHRRGITVECEACGWQGDEAETDTRYCQNCGGECFDLKDLYADEESLPADESPNAI
jgi:hypothetical protein